MTPGPPSIRTASAAATNTGSNMIRCSHRNRDVEHTLDQPRRPVKIGIADSHDRNGADVVGQSGLGVEVMHPRNDEQVCVLALPRYAPHRSARVPRSFHRRRAEWSAPVVATAMSRSARRPRRGTILLRRKVVAIIDESIHFVGHISDAGQGFSPTQRPAVRPQSGRCDACAIPLRRAKAMRRVVMTRPTTTSTMAWQAVSRKISTCLLLVHVEDHCGNRRRGRQQPSDDRGQLVQDTEM